MRRLVVTSVLGSMLVVPALGLALPASAAATYVVGQPSASCPSPDYSTIAAAVSAATSGDTIQVCAGSYSESVDDQGKNLTFLGAKAGVDGRTRSASTSATDESQVASTQPGVNLHGSSSVDGFQIVTIAGGAETGAALVGNSSQLANSVLIAAPIGIAITGSSELVVRNQVNVAVDIAGFSGTGVLLDQGHGANSVIRDNSFSGDLTGAAVAIGPTDGSAVVDGVEVYRNSAQLVGNTTFLSSANTTNLSVTDNTVSPGSGGYSGVAVHVSGGNAGFDISRNRFTGGSYGVEEEGSNDGGTITRNVIRNAGFGVYVDGPSGNLGVHSNIFTGNSTEAVASTFGNPDTVHAQNNFYGCNDGPTGLNGCDGVPASGVEKTPYLVLTSTIATHSAHIGQAVSFHATLNRNSDGHLVAVPVLDGEPIAFTYDRGTVNPATATLVNGGASTTARPTSNGSGTVTATVDNATSSQALNSAPPRPQIRISDAGTNEGDNGAHALVFRVALNHPTSVPVTVRYATANSSATAPSDYTAKSGTVTFPAGTTYRQISVSIRGDRVHEPNETFLVKLSSPTNAGIADGTGTGVIRNDD